MAEIPFFAALDVEAAVPPERAYDAVLDAFVAHARGEWTMQPKLYVTNYPAGDFRAMPALGGGHALLKWVTSFPGNPERGLPTVSGLVVLSDASTGLVEAVLDAGSVTAPDEQFAEIYAREQYGRRQESVALWLVPREAVSEIDEFPDEFEMKYRRVDGYSIKARLHEARERAGTLDMAPGASE